MILIVFINVNIFSGIQKQISNSVLVLCSVISTYLYVLVHVCCIEVTSNFSSPDMHTVDGAFSQLLYQAQDRAPF